MIEQAGFAMLGLALVVTLAGLAAALPRALRATRRTRSVQAQGMAAAADLRRGQALLRARIESTRLGMRPVRRLWKWARHPMVGALWASYRIRRRRAAAARV